MQDDRVLMGLRGRRLDRGEVDAGRDDVRVRHPPDRVVRADHDRARSTCPLQVLGRPPADVRAEEVHHAPLPHRLEQRELELLGNERQAEVEVEDVGPGREPCERAPLRRLPAEQPAAALQVDVRLGMQAVAVEDDELRVDAACAQRLHVRPRDAGRVDGTVNNPHGFHSTWSKYRSAVRPGRTRDRSAASSSSEISPSARFTASHGRSRSSWYTMVEMRGFTSMTWPPTSWMLKNHSISSSRTIRSAVSISPSSSSVTKYIARPARIASRVFGWPRTTRSPSAMPSIVRSPPVASSITSSSVPPSSGSSSSASSSRIDTEPGRSCSSWCARSTVGSRMRKPREPDENTGLKQTGRSG